MQSSTFPYMVLYDQVGTGHHIRECAATQVLLLLIQNGIINFTE